MKKYWFKRKRYGWGWYPTTIQGWLVLASFIALIVGNDYRIENHFHTQQAILAHMIPQTIILIAILIIICWATGESPRWQWGNDQDQNKLNK